MTAMTTTQIAHLNKMNRASKDVLLGTRIDTLEGNLGASGSHVVTSGEATASAISITTGITSVTGFIVQGYRSGSPLDGVKVLTSSGSLAITSSASASWVIAASDVINYIVW